MKAKLLRLLHWHRYDTHERKTWPVPLEYTELDEWLGRDPHRDWQTSVICACGAVKVTGGQRWVRP